MSESLLSEPGILLRMIAPEPSQPVDVESARPHAVAAAPAPASVARAARAALGALLWSAACAWFVLDAAATRSMLTQMAAASVADWLPLLAVAVASALLAGRLAAVPRGRAAAALAAAFAFSIAALVEVATRIVWLDAHGVGPAVTWRLLCHASGLGICLGLLCQGRSSTAARAPRVATANAWAAAFATTALAAVAAAGAGLAWARWQSRLGGDATGAIALGLALATLVAAGATSALADAAQRRAFRSGPWLALAAVACLLWLVAPPGLWCGASDAPVVGYCAAVAAASWAIARAAPGLAVGVALAAAALPVWQRSAVAVPDGVMRLVASGTVSAVYDRATQTMSLFDRGRWIDAAGPDCPAAPLAAVIVRSGLAAGDRVLVIGQGTGRLPRLLLQAGLHEVEVADARPDAWPLLERLDADGPVAMPGPDTCRAPAGLRVHAAGMQHTLANLADASRRTIVLAEPLLANVPQTSLEMQLELRRVVGSGWLLQTWSMERSPAPAVRALLLAAVHAHAWNAVFAVGDAAVLLSAAAAPNWIEPSAALDDTFDAWPDDAQWIAHAAHLGGVADLRRACLGTLAPAAAGAADVPQAAADGTVDRATARTVCTELLHALPESPNASPSVLLGWNALQAELRRTANTLRSLGSGAEAKAEAQALAARFLYIGAPLAILQAALGLPTADGITLRDPAAASLCAHALDPTFFASAPPLFADLPIPRQAIGDLEDFGRLPAPERLAELCVGPGPLAMALRARFGSRCARALLQRLADAGLTSAQTQALRELADPFVLALAARVLRSRDALPELLSLWRGDLPMPQALSDLARGDTANRRLLAASLQGRRDTSMFGVLADFLVAPEPELRELAAAALRGAVGDRVPYDPAWPRSALNEAADHVRSMHNRSP